MMIPRKPIGRRTLLRGLGTTMALPLLDAMLPSAKAADAAQGIKRFQVFYSPNGMMMQDYVPAESGANYTMTPILKPLEAYRDKFTVTSGFGHLNATALGDGPGDHGRSCSSFLTAVHPKKTEGYDIRAGVSLDQMIANELGKATQISSLQLGIEPASFLGSCDSGYSCAYTNTLSWNTPTTPLPVTVNPRDLFEILFGDGDSLDPASRMAQLRHQASILDFVMDGAGRMATGLGADDKRKLDEYMTSVRDIERRIQMAEKGGIINASMERPSGIPDDFQEHVHMMIDLQVLAMQADLTRVITFMLARELSNRSYPEIGVPDAHHAISHHGGDPVKIAKLVKINTYHMEQFAYYLKRMGETKEGSGNLLDRTLVLEGPSLGDPNKHDHLNFPLIVAGGLTKGNRHIPIAKGTPMANLMVSFMQILGVQQDRIGDSTGPFTEIMA